MSAAATYCRTQRSSALDWPSRPCSRVTTAPQTAKTRPFHRHRATEAHQPDPPTGTHFRRSRIANWATLNHGSASTAPNGFTSLPSSTMTTGLSEPRKTKARARPSERRGLQRDRTTVQLGEIGDDRETEP